MPKKILVVDDERHIVRLVQVTLERAGYQVAVAYDGRECLQNVTKEKPDLIVLDVMMPHMDGFEVLQNLKANQETDSIPVVMLTAKAQDQDIFRGWQQGVEWYQTKPFNPMELLTVIKRIFQSQEQPPDEDGVIQL
jgi:two-component system alkaline phosphatase synthesis response regulator PhoP/two-component system response regulator VicR